MKVHVLVLLLGYSIHIFFPNFKRAQNTKHPKKVHGFRTPRIRQILKHFAKSFHPRISPSFTSEEECCI